MRLFTSNKIVSLLFLSIAICGCSSSFDDNNNYTTKDILHKQNLSLYSVNNNYVKDNNIFITVSDNRPFLDTGSVSDDLSSYFIDLNQDDTKENREKTVGYMLTTFTGASNVVIPYNITSVIKNYIEYSLENKLVKDKKISVKINELWESPRGISSNVFLNFITKRNYNFIEGIGYRYSIDVNLKDTVTDSEKSFSCVNGSYRDNVWFTEEEISSIFNNMMDDVKKCINEHL